MDTTIRRLVVAEATALASFAEFCFREAFATHFEAGSMGALCTAAFARPVMEKLLLDGVWLAGDWLGYIALGAVPCPIPELAGPSMELARLYVPRSSQGMGIADQLMGQFLIEVAERQGRSIWLQAYEGSPRALAFYRRWRCLDFGPYVVTWQGLALPHRLLGRNLAC